MLFTSLLGNGGRFRKFLDVMDTRCVRGKVPRLVGRLCTKGVYRRTSLSVLVGRCPYKLTCTLTLVSAASCHSVAPK